MINEGMYIVRAAKGKEGKVCELTIPAIWRNTMGIDIGDELRVLSEAYMVVLPPRVDKWEIEEVRTFLGGRL